MDSGGLLLRFASPKLAQAIDLDGPALLLPTPVRKGTRTLGGVLSWNKPVTLNLFSEDSPFFGIAVPTDTTVRQQLLAEPEAGLEPKIWARLADGTPLISAARKGQGWLVLVHTTADTRWSNMALSGLFVSLLERIVDLSQGVEETQPGQDKTPLSPLLALDGFARLVPPSPDAKSIATNKIDVTVPGPDHPPGFYGRGGDGQDHRMGGHRALNLSPSLTDVRAFPETEFTTEYYGESRQIDFRPGLFLAAFLLFLADLLAVVYLKGLLKRKSAIVVILMGLFTTSHAIAQTEVPAAALQTQLAYFMTGDARQDLKSRDGLRGLSMMVNRRTAAELGKPVGINPATDELAFYPLIYWPLGVPGKSLPNEAVQAITGYLKRGGTILFDTADGNRGGASLGALAHALGLPPLIPMGADHVLGRAFYLLKTFPGRWTGGRVWVEDTTERVNDGVSAVIAGGHDWAAAWATDDAGRPLFALNPGGSRQRELAFRFGINLVMYVLTGNYKSDQVHLPSIIERLRQ